MSENQEPIRINSGQFPCPNCGAFMKYSPETGGLSCEYCKTEMDITKDDSEIKEYRFDVLDELSNHHWNDDKRVIKCESCGGETIIRMNEITKTCVFCGSAQVVTEALEEGIPPESLIPFMVTRAAARADIKRWVSGKFYAPKALKELKKLDKLTSLYIPYFTFDSDTSTFYIGQKGTHYYVSRTKIVDGKTKTVRERRTRWQHVDGVYKEAFDDILIHATNKLDQKLLQSMKSFDLKALEAYQEEYLIGHQAERYTVKLTDGWDEAKTEMKQIIYQGIRNQVGGDEFRLTNHTTDYGDPYFKHILLPVWITTYAYKDKTYPVYINGQTGHVVGEYPKSIIKILLTIVGFVGIAIIIYMLINSGVFQ